MFLSIITPTYNRAYILPKCYESLKKQKCLDFEWIVIDDGSTDNTEELIKSFIEDKIINVKYVKQKNAGKHVAHNKGAELAQGEMFLCLDSDDQLTEDAVLVVKQFWAENLTEKYTGILAKRGEIKSRQPICGNWDENLSSSTMFDLFNEHGFKGDTALFFKTDILKKEKFVFFDGEKFIPETALYCEIDKYGEMLLLDKVLYLTEYLPDGLTAKYHSLLTKCPNGTTYSYYQQLCASRTCRQAFKYAMLVQIYKSLSKNSNKIRFDRKRGWLLLSWLPAKIYRKRFLTKFNKGEK